MRRRPEPFRALIVALGLNPLQGFVGPLLPESPCGSTKQAGARSPVASSNRLPKARPRPTSGLWMSAGEGEEKMEEEGIGAGESDDGDEEEAVAVVKKDPGVLVATGASGALVGWSLAHSLGMDLDFFGAVTGCLAAVGLLGQEGEVGKATSKVGKFALGAFDVVSVVATSTDVPAKVAETVGEEFLEVVEFASGAVTKGYLDSLPEPNVRLEAEIEASKSTVADLRGQLDTVKSALAEAKERLAERAENKKTVDAAKATAAQLAEAKAAMVEKNAEIAKVLQLARQEKETFDRNLAAAKAETLRFREMAESRSDMDDNFKALAQASDTLEKRVQEYEGRLRILTDENESIRSDYGAEIKSMEAERASMRERISGLEASLSGAESRLDEQRAELEGELSKMGDALDERTAEVETAKRLAAKMEAAVAASVADKAKAVEVAAAEAAKRAAREEKERAALEAKAAKEQAAAASKAAAAEKAAIAAEMAVREREQRERLEKNARDEQAVAARRMEEALAAKKNLEGMVAAQNMEAMAAEEEHAARQRPQEVQAGGEPREGANPALADLKPRAAATKAKATVERKKPATAAAATPAAKVASAASPAKAKVAARKGTGAAGGALTPKEALMQSTVKDLRERCKAAGVPTTGRKADLVERLSS